MGFKHLIKTRYHNADLCKAKGVQDNLEMINQTDQNTFNPPDISIATAPCFKGKEQMKNLISVEL